MKSPSPTHPTQLLVRRQSRFAPADSMSTVDDGCVKEPLEQGVQVPTTSLSGESAAHLGTIPHGSCDGGSDHGATGDAEALEEPDKAIATAIEEFVPPATHEVLQRPSRITSPIWAFGVKLKLINGTKFAFACFGSPKCRGNSNKGMFIAVSDKSNSNALNHVRGAHKIERAYGGKSRKTASTEATIQQRVNRRASKARSSGMFSEDHPHFMAVTWVKCHIVEGFRPFSAGEKEWVRLAWILTGHKDFPVDRLHREAVKHIVTELYASTTEHFKSELRAEVGKEALLHLNLDFWVDKLSTLRYLGIRVFYIDRNWQLKSRLLAVRQFNPSSQLLEDDRLSALLLSYLGEVLEEFGLSVEHLFSATTSSGCGFKRLCEVLLPGLWEWCMCSLVNDALSELWTGAENSFNPLDEAIGTAVDPERSANTKARQFFMVVKEVVEHVRKSPGAKAIFDEEQALQFSHCCRRKAVSAVPQRWSGVCGVLGAIISNWAAVDGVYMGEGEENPLREWKKEIGEAFSIVKPCAELIAECQKTSVPTGQAALFGLAALRLTTLNFDSPLDIAPLAHDKGWLGVAGADGEDSGVCDSSREHTDLTEVAQHMRQCLRGAIDRCFFDKRYKSADDEATDFVFDMQMALHPTTASLNYIDKLAATPSHATAVKKVITDKVVALAVKLAEWAAANAENETVQPPAKKTRQANCATGNGRTAGGRSQRVDGCLSPVFQGGGTKKEVETTEKYAGLGLFEKAETEGPPVPPTYEQLARAELARLGKVTAGTLTADLSFEGILQWWKRLGGDYPLLSRAARVIFGAQASSSVLERDFGDAGRMTMSSRGSTDAAYVDMVLFLHGNLELIPEEVRKIAAEGDGAMHSKIPGRLSAPNPELADLGGDFMTVDLSGVGDDDQLDVHNDGSEG